MKTRITKLNRDAADLELRECRVHIKSLKLELTELGHTEFPLFPADIAARIALLVLQGPQEIEWLREHVRIWCRLERKNVLHFDGHFEFALERFETDGQLVYPLKGPMEGWELGQD